MRQWIFALLLGVAVGLGCDEESSRDVPPGPSSGSSVAPPPPASPGTAEPAEPASRPS